MNKVLAKCVYTLVLIFTCNNVQANCKDVRLSGDVDQQSLWQDISFLASDDMQGRLSNSEGAAKARRYISQRYKNIGLKSFSTAPQYLLPFSHEYRGGEVYGENIVGWLAGTQYPEQYIVVTAHYDHIGKSGKQIFNGADDNASGVAAMLALAQQIFTARTRYSTIFVATDAEEKGLYGAKEFVRNPPIPIGKIKYNLNLDMLAQGGRRNKLYVSGANNNDELKQVVQQTVQEAGLCLVNGHRQQGGGLFAKKVNWRKASDHAAFASKGIAYLYVGVDVHPDYHTIHDEVAKIDPIFYTAAVETALKLLRHMDEL